MMKREAVRTANSLAGLRPRIYKNPLAPKWDSFVVEYEYVFVDKQGDIDSVRMLIK